MANEFIIKINKDSHGNELSLASMSIEAADALKIFIESLSQFAKLSNKAADMKLSLKDGCIESALVYPESEVKIDEEIQSIVDGKSDNNEFIKFFKDIQDKIQANGLDYSVMHFVNGEKIDLTETFKAKKFAYKRPNKGFWKEEIVFIEGRLFESGGKTKTNIHLDYKGKEFAINCSINQAIKINKLLYQQVYVCALKKWKFEGQETYELIDTYLLPGVFRKYKNFYQSIKEDDSLERFDIIHDNVVSIIEKRGLDVPDIFRLMRLYNHPQSDKGIVQTILMALKPLRRHERVSGIYQELAALLK
ncbi:hypothetical protein GKZ68_02450 [Hymenobacter sp. BRD128]|uniref:hypothetical protein n=1 Tax=Hymenobacter sp. BRD128 TaxID=2675878 RepID=UPI001564ED58|nr:hypothetical protein [Hymenobacter sp. BRD128]QKG55595.1 hypothetical protein GKZ68_02450 [Hymenobacter sp. BRD128]